MFVVGAAVQRHVTGRARSSEGAWAILDGFEVEEWRQWVSMCPPVAGEGVGDELKQKSPAGGGRRLGSSASAVLGAVVGGFCYCWDDVSTATAAGKLDEVVTAVSTSWDGGSPYLIPPT